MAQGSRRKTAESETTTFETLFASLEEKARRLEQGNLPLDESLKLYEEGAALADRLREILAAAELRVRTVQRRFESDDIGPPPDEEGDYSPED
jgi:exodeoxyribonuclease VII small subunit